MNSPLRKLHVILAALCLPASGCVPAASSASSHAAAPGATTAATTAHPPLSPPASSSAPGAGGAAAEVRFISIAPSPYSHRHDAFRAGFGIFLSLRKLVDANQMPLRLSYYDGSCLLEDAEKIKQVFRGPRVFVLGSSTWAQGPTFHVRRFLEQAGSEVLLGASATAWATAGGAHTGGEEVVSTTLRSLMGMGAQTFTLGQKYMVFTTDERLDPPTPGAFGLLDLWYMDRFARYIAVVALAGNDRERARTLAQQLGVGPHYYTADFPPSAETLATHRDLQAQLNAAANQDSDAYRHLRSMVANPCN